MKWNYPVWEIKKKRNGQNLKDLWDNIGSTYAKCVTGVTEGEEKEDGGGRGNIIWKNNGRKLSKFDTKH